MPQEGFPRHANEALPEDFNWTAAMRIYELQRRRPIDEAHAEKSEYLLNKLFRLKLGETRFRDRLMWENNGNTHNRPRSSGIEQQGIVSAYRNHHYSLRPGQSRNGIPLAG